ncbi:MAG: uridine kinase [Candidatus Solibacter usitatus]|nr:uridine kinase [Candidatus Solibacter usitatus]
MQPVRVIGIAGPSCSGKGTLTHWLAARLAADVLPLDAYYFPLDDKTVEERARVNFDHPESIDHELLLRHLSHVLEGRTVERPVYDFARHTRKAETISLSPTPFLILEGLFALHWEPLRKLQFASVYIDAPDRVCLDRRLDRDQRERGRSAESILEQYRATVQPMRAAYIDPDTRYAGLVVDGTQPVEDNGNRVVRFLEATTIKARSGVGATA